MKTPAVQREGDFAFVFRPYRGLPRAARPDSLWWRVDACLPPSAYPVADLEWRPGPPRCWVLSFRPNPLLGVMAERCPRAWVRPAGFRPRSVPPRVRRDVVVEIAAWSVGACIAAMEEEIYGDPEEASA